MLPRYNRTHDPLFIKLNNNINCYYGKYFNTTLIDFNLPIIYNKSWFFNLKYNYKFNYDFNKFKFNLNDKENQNFEYKTIKIKFFPTQQQKDILKYWFDAYNIMFNETILFLRKHIPYGNITFYKNYYGSFKKYNFNIKEINKLNNLIKKYTESKNLLLQDVIKMKEEISKIKNNSKNKFNQFHKINLKLSKVNSKILQLNCDKNILLNENSNLSKNNEMYKSLGKHINEFLDYKYIRTNYLKNKKNEIAENYSFAENNHKNKIHTHSLDCAIKRACATYKTCIDNFLNKRIRRFRIRCRNLEKSKLLDIDTTSFNYDKEDEKYYICKNILGKIKLEYNNKIYEIKKPTVSTIHLEKGYYNLLIPVPIEKATVPAKNKFIALDGGVRDFLTGFTDNSVIKYGHNLTEKLKDYYKKIDTLNSLNIFQKKNVNNLIKESQQKTLELIFKHSKLNYGVKKDEYLNKIKNEGEYYDNLLNLGNKNLIDLEIKRYNNSILKHKEVKEKIIIKENLNSHYEKRIKKITKMIENNEKKIVKLEIIKGKEKEKYEKYLWYLKKNKIDHYNRKIKNKINELHWQTASEIARENEIVILGKINSKSIIMNNELNKLTKRVLQSLSHYSFREKLVYKCLTYNRNIKIQNEKFTTKMCCLCGYYNENIKGEKKIKCNNCKEEYDRDSGSAVNILLASLE